MVQMALMDRMGCMVVLKEGEGMKAGGIQYWVLDLKCDQGNEKEWLLRSIDSRFD